MTSDADGNTLTDTSGRVMTGDSQNRMASCTKSGVTTTCGADGLRRSSTVNGVTTYYVYDGTTLIREMHQNVQTGALYSTATYLTGPRGPEYQRDDTATELDSQGRQVSKTRWYVYDGLGSVVGEVDPSGSLASGVQRELVDVGGTSAFVPPPNFSPVNKLYPSARGGSQIACVRPDPRAHNRRGRQAVAERESLAVVVGAFVLGTIEIQRPVQRDRLAGGLGRAGADVREQLVALVERDPHGVLGPRQVVPAVFLPVHDDVV